MANRTRRVLFALNEPGYFRFYGPAIVELERRGWNVSLVYGKPEKRGPDVDVPSASGDRVRSLGTLPGDVSPFAKKLRIAVDCARYLEPAFADAEYLRRRAERELPAGFGFMKHIKRVPRFVISASIAVARFLERLLPVNPLMRDFLSELQPDLVVVSPLVIIGGSGVQETEVIKAARALGIPTAVGVASWDHLTSKGLIRLVPDAVLVWNDLQADEAERNRSLDGSIAHRPTRWMRFAAIWASTATVASCCWSDRHATWRPATPKCSWRAGGLPRCGRQMTRTFAKRS
jgi:hypothetical protein